MKRRMTVLSLVLLLVISLAGCGSTTPATIPETTVVVTGTTVLETTVAVPETTEPVIETTATVTEPVETVPETTETVIETTEAVTEATTQPTEPTEEMVWIPTGGGTKYHIRESCSNMKNPSHVPLSTAISRGFTPCKKCY